MAIAALQTAIQMDREYGFREDANDNYQTLLLWNGRAAGSDEAAALMKDYPQRSTTLSFGWFDSKADLTLTLEYQQLSGNGELNMHGMKAAERRVRQRVVGAYRARGTHYEVNWQSDESLVQGIVVSLTRMPLQLPTSVLRIAGNFSQSTAA